MFSYVKQVGISTALSQEAPAFLASFVIAEVFYKFHSFTLECAAFLVTWYGLSWVQSLIVGPRAK
ncbi:MAG TPA: hypothetical protein VK746_02585 [Candidatus Eisenbacteria bacterium]|jgi:hypothetical protein|nr:hypothetical protein [Candidatus Eisenbacteria bacterium]